MIFDSIVNAARNEALKPRFALSFRLYADLAKRSDFAPGRYDLKKAGSIYTVVVDAPGRVPADAPLETHRAYIDIRFAVVGCDPIGWASAAAISSGGGSEAAKDIEFLTVAPITWLDVPAAHFAIFFPEDARATMANAGKPTRKIVLKVAV